MLSYCTQCGAKLPESSRYCGACGASVSVSGKTGEAPSGSGPHPEQRPPAKETVRSTVAATPVYIGLGRRLVAHLLDLCLVFLMFYVIGQQVAENTGGMTPDGFSLDGTPALVVLVLTFLASILYFTLTEGAGGQSFGKKIVGIKVVSEDGSSCSIGQAFSRNVLRLVDGIAFYLVGVISVMRSETKQRLGDRFAGTVVIRKSKVEQTGSFTYNTMDDQPEAEKADGKAKFRSSWGLKRGRDTWDY